MEDYFAVDIYDGFLFVHMFYYMLHPKKKHNYVLKPYFSYIFSIFSFASCYTNYTAKNIRLHTWTATTTENAFCFVRLLFPSSLFQFYALMLFLFLFFFTIKHYYSFLSFFFVYSCKCLWINTKNIKKSQNS